MPNKLLAIVGLAGAGKTVCTEYIVKKTGWPKVYLGQAVVEGALQKYGQLSEQNERKVREELRAQYGMAALAIANLPKIKELHASSNVIIESLYSWEEYLEFKKQFGENFKVLAVYSSFETRARRMAVREIRPLSPADLDSRDCSQIENLHQAGLIARADWTILNESDLNELYAGIDLVLTKIYESKN